MRIHHARVGLLTGYRPPAAWHPARADHRGNPGTPSGHRGS